MWVVCQKMFHFIKKRLWTKRNVPLLRQTVKNRLPQVPSATELESEESINDCVSAIVDALKASIDASTP
jgi:hypothetical protein